MTAFPPILQVLAFAWACAAQEVSDGVGAMGTGYRQVFTLDASHIQTSLENSGRELGLDSVSHHSTEI